MLNALPYLIGLLIGLALGLPVGIALLAKAQRRRRNHAIRLQRITDTIADHQKANRGYMS